MTQIKHQINIYHFKVKSTTLHLQEPQQTLQKRLMNLKNMYIREN